VQKQQQQRTRTAACAGEHNGRVKGTMVEILNAGLGLGVRG